MSDRHIKRIKQYLEDLIEERNDLVQNVETLVNTANIRVQSISESQASRCEKEALLTFLTKTLALFSEINHSVLKCLETVEVPTSNSTHSVQQSYGCSSQELQDYFKADVGKMGTSSFDFSKDGPKVSNDQVQNESYVRKPLDDITLKAICSTFINNNAGVISTSHNIIENGQSTLCNNVPDNKTNCLKQQHDDTNVRVSPTVSYSSEFDAFSTISSSTCQHPLTKICPPTEIPKQYDTGDLEKVKENMKYLSRKMGFDSEGFAQMSSQFDKTVPSFKFQYEEPEKDVQTEDLVIKNEICQDSLVASTKIEETNDFDPVRLNNEIGHSSNDLDNQNSVGPSRSTGAIRKQIKAEKELIDLSGPISNSENSDKVTSWLAHESQSENPPVSCAQTTSPQKNNSAIEKLETIKRHDRNEEAREKARADMPNLRLIPVETSQVIKNDLNSDSSSSGKADKKPAKKKSKVKDLNKETAVYEIQKMDVPQIGAICVFSHIESPSEFYIQILNDLNSAHLDMVSQSLDEQFSKTESKFRTKQEACTKMGKFCYGYIWGERKSWYRLQVLDWKLDCTSDEVEVLAVDYGFKCETSFIYLRELTKDLAHIKMLAIKCHFALLYPPNSTYSNRLTQSWPPSTTEALYDIVNLSKDLAYVPKDITLFEIVFSEPEGESLAVDLAHYLTSNEDTLGQLLINMGLAIEILDDYGDNPELADFLEDVDELERADNLNEFLLGYDAKDEARICKFSRKDGTCFKGKHCKLEHIQLKDGYTTDKTAVFHVAINDLILPRKGDTVQVLISKYVDSCTYLAQMIRNPVRKENTTIVMDKDISDLMDAMNHPKLVAKYEPFKISPAIGEVILAFHPIAKQWIRVAVRELAANDDPSCIEVYSVDFGDEFVIKTKQIRMMEEMFMHVPFQVIQIYLDNYQHRSDCDSSKAMKFFKNHIGYKSFLAFIKSNDLPFRVSLTTFKGREIGPTLAREGFAEPRTIDLYLTEDMILKRTLDLE